MHHRPGARHRPGPGQAVSARPHAFAFPVSYAGSAAHEAYNAWVDHGRKCTPCLSAGRAENSPCQDGRDAWAEYEATREAAEPPVVSVRLD